MPSAIKLMKVVKKTRNRLVSKPLAKGQLWQLDDRHLEIVEMGKHLTHYRLLHGLNQKGVPVRLGRVEDIQAYLGANRAKLVRN